MRHTAHLHARPSPSGQITHAAAHGQHPLNLGSRRESFFYVPTQYDPAQPCPLVLLLHGAGGHAHHGLDILKHLADVSGVILVAPASSDHTWDVIGTRVYGPDVLLVDRALDHMFKNFTVDTSHIAIGGFSDGASYALSLGLANGDLFTHVIAFSPGFIAPFSPRGQPRVFISHGTQDDILPIEACGRRIAPRLEYAGYDVTYHEFEGGHTIPADIASEAMNWFVPRAAA